MGDCEGQSRLWYIHVGLSFFLVEPLGVPSSGLYVILLHACDPAAQLQVAVQSTGLCPLNPTGPELGLPSPSLSDSYKC